MSKYMFGYVALVCAVVIIFYVLNHDNFAMGDNAEKSLEQTAKTSTDCTPLRWMVMDHQDDWFPAKYVLDARERMMELKC